MRSATLWAIAFAAAAPLQGEGTTLMMSVHGQARSKEYMDMLSQHQRLFAAGEGNLLANLSSVENKLSTTVVAFGGQEVSLVLDTGSTNTWVTSTKCGSDICKTHKRYDPAKSKTLREVGNSQEVVYIQFGTGQVSGVLKEETVTVGGKGGIELQNQTFLLVQGESGSVFNEKGFSGILGLGFRSLAYQNHLPLFDHMCQKGLVHKNQFYFLLANPASQYFVMGETADFNSQIKGELHSVPIVDPYYWTVELDDLKFNGKSILTEDVRKTVCKVTDNSKTSCRVAFDSGSTLNTVPSEIYSRIVSSHMTEHCDKMSPKAMGELTYVIGGKEFKFHSEEYTEVVDSSKCSTLLMQNLDLTNDHGPIFILGRVFLSKYLAVFRRGDGGKDEGSQILLAEANPTYVKPVSQAPSTKEENNQNSGSIRESVLGKLGDIMFPR